MTMALDPGTIFTQEDVDGQVLNFVVESVVGLEEDGVSKTVVVLVPADQEKQPAADIFPEVQAVSRSTGTDRFTTIIPEGWPDSWQAKTKN